MTYDERAKAAEVEAALARTKLDEALRLAKRADEGGAFDSLYAEYYTRRIALAAETRARSRLRDFADLQREASHVRDRYIREVRQRATEIVGFRFPDNFAHLFREAFGVWPGALSYGRPRP